MRNGGADTIADTFVEVGVTSDVPDATKPPVSVGGLDRPTDVEDRL